MKNLVLLIMAFILIAGINSCSKKGCTNKLAVNYDSNATEDDGSCDLGKQALYGTWLMTDTGVNNPSNPIPITPSYNIVISEELSAPNRIKIFNLANTPSSIYAEYVNSTSLILPEQNNNGIDRTGTAVISGNKIRFTYYIGSGKAVGTAIKQ